MVPNPTTRTEEKPFSQRNRKQPRRPTHLHRQSLQESQRPQSCQLSQWSKGGSKAFARYRDIDEDMKKELVNLLD